MPLYTFECKKCDNSFETLVMGSDKPACPACGGEDLARVFGVTAAPPTYKSTIKSARNQARREGHMSNYSRSSQQRLSSGKSE